MEDETDEREDMERGVEVEESADTEVSLSKSTSPERNSCRIGN